MNILHQHTATKGKFFMEEDGELLAELVYAQPSTGQMILEHTYVDDELRGQNIGFELVQRAVHWARTHGLRVVPTCPFAQAVFQRKPDLCDVLDKPEGGDQE